MKVTTLTLPQIIEREKIKTEKTFISEILEKYDLLDVIILRMFFTDNDFPSDIVPRSLNEIYNLLKEKGISVSKMTVLNRLQNFVNKKILKKLEKTMPSMYVPISSEDVIRKVDYIISIVEAIVARK
jgi:hypothetical protein